MNSPPESKVNGVPYIVFLAALAAVPPLATDMYLGAMPLIASQWAVPDSQVAWSLVLWFVTFSVFLLICGPLSDKYGRKPILLIGLSVFAAASVACALAGNIIHLIAFRMLQGAGAAGPSSMCMAICRDRYEGTQRKRILAYVGIILGLAPMIAPTIGAAVLVVSTWRVIFALQAILAAGTWLIAVGFRETANRRVTGSFIKLMARYGDLARNRRYLLATSAMGLIVGPFYGFIAFAPVVYIQVFGLSNATFGLLFGANALVSMLGAYTCTRVMAFASDTKLLTICLLGCAAGGAGILLCGSWHYAAFALCMAVVTFFCGMSRPLSNHLILEQVQHDIGSASSFLVFYQFVAGALCMRIVTMPWQRPIVVFGVLAVLLPAAVLCVWPGLLRLLKLTADSPSAT